MVTRTPSFEDATRSGPASNFYLPILFPQVSLGLLPKDFLTRGSLRQHPSSNTTCLFSTTTNTTSTDGASDESFPNAHISVTAHVHHYSSTKPDHSPQHVHHYSPTKPDYEQEGLVSQMEMDVLASQIAAMREEIRMLRAEAESNSRQVRRRSEGLGGEVRNTWNYWQGDHAGRDEWSGGWSGTKHWRDGWSGGGQEGDGEKRWSEEWDGAQDESGRQGEWGEDWGGGWGHGGWWERK